MKKLVTNGLYLTILSSLILFASCDDEPNHVDVDCGIVQTQINELSHSVGSYVSSIFSNNSSTNFEDAAIKVEIKEILGEPDCFTFTPQPQIIETITVSSSSDLVSGGIKYSSGESLNQLFKIYNNENTYSIPEFINAQTLEPLIFHKESDKIVLQLLNKPDVSINQSIEIALTFDDLEIQNIEILNFEVSN